MKRDTAQTIFRTVVFAGAMLGVPALGACSKKQAATKPTNTSNAAPAPAATEGTSATKPADAADPCAGAADPCAGDGRIRGSDGDGGGGAGRGFVLS